MLHFDGTRRFFQCLDVLFDNKDPLVFVEVGGCTGGLVRNFLSYDNNSTIFCVEPNSSLAGQLKLEFNNNVDVENIGLGSKAGKGILHITNKPQYIQDSLLIKVTQI